MTEQFTFGLIGENIGYSHSPAVFAAIFKVDRVSGSFRLFDLSSEDFEVEFERVLESGVQGLSVTIPHKERVVPFMAELDEAAQALGAVNSIAVQGRLRGFNTDVAGFSAPLQGFRDQLAGQRALILGSGGAARAAVYALSREFGVAEFLMVSRQIETLGKTRQQLLLHLGGININTVLADDLAESRLGPIGVAVNATPLGGWNHPNYTPFPSGFDWSRVGLYYDLNYNDENRLIEAARDAGVTAIDGSQMLAGQAVESYRLWTGRVVAFEPVYAQAFPRYLNT